MDWDYEGRIPITIDFNADTFASLEERLIIEGKNPWDYEVVLTNAQFQTFKLMYRLERTTFENNCLIWKQETIQPTTIGSVYGIFYHVE